VTAVGDSVMLASAGGLLDELPGVQIDAEVSRSMWAGSKIIDRLSDQGALRDYVVVGLGTNGPVDSDALQDIYDRVGRDRTLVLVTAFAPRDWIPGVNAELTAFAASHPGVVIADWSGAIAPHTDVLAGDGIHPGETGGRIYADTVTHAVDAVANQRAQTRYQVQLIRWATSGRSPPRPRPEPHPMPPARAAPCQMCDQGDGPFVRHEAQALVEGVGARRAGGVDVEHRLLQTGIGDRAQRRRDDGGSQPCRRRARTTPMRSMYEFEAPRLAQSSSFTDARQNADGAVGLDDQSGQIGAEELAADELGPRLGLGRLPSDRGTHRCAPDGRRITREYATMRIPLSRAASGRATSGAPSVRSRSIVANQRSAARPADSASLWLPRFAPPRTPAAERSIRHPAHQGGRVRPPPAARVRARTASRTPHARSPRHSEGSTAPDRCTFRAPRAKGAGTSCRTRSPRPRHPAPAPSREWSMCARSKVSATSSRGVVQSGGRRARRHHHGVDRVDVVHRRGAPRRDLRVPRQLTAVGPDGVGTRRCAHSETTHSPTPL
jgi:hypothetical protein